MDENIGGVFFGNIEGFKRYIGPFCRNEVQVITKSYKKQQNGVCQNCGAKVGELDAAHVKGVERADIISRILESNFQSKEIPGMYSVELNEFKDMFREAHMPISEHFLFLCKKCHTEYDAK